MEKPCISRATSSSSGAANPIDAYEGIRPIANVLAAISIMVAASTLRRPIRSPSGPKNSPPSGRTTNAAAKVPNEAISCTPGEADSKNTSPMITAR